MTTRLIRIGGQPKESSHFGSIGEAKALLESLLAARKDGDQRLGHRAFVDDSNVSVRKPHIPTLVPLSTEGIRGRPHR